MHQYCFSELLLALFGIAMAISQGIKSPQHYSASAAALLVARQAERSQP